MQNLSFQGLRIFIHSRLVFLYVNRKFINRVRFIKRKKLFKTYHCFFYTRGSLSMLFIIVSIYKQFRRSVVVDPLHLHDGVAAGDDDSLAASVGVGGADPPCSAAGNVGVFAVRKPFVVNKGLPSSRLN